MEAGTLSGRYETSERLGSGGMSNVYKATDRILERTVAVKILAEHLSDDDRFVARFRREALAVARLIHPNIVQVYDSGVDDGRHYIVMEYVAGRSGAQLLQRHGPVDTETAAEIGIQACAGLDYAHRRGIIHRDVKPGNLMITGGPVGSGDTVVKLTDFGIARAIEQTRITQVGSVVGTAAYLSPEQVRGEEATPATDVYALGVVLYQFLTGRLPYEGSSLAELAVRQQNEKPLPPSTYNSDVPTPMSAAVLRALEGDTSRRYASADEFATGLQMGLEGEDVADLPYTGEGHTPTRVLGSDTAATRHLDRTTAQTEYRPAPAPSPTRRPEPRRQDMARRSDPYAGDPRMTGPVPPVQPAVPRKRSAFSRFVRFVLALVALMLVAGAVATAVILTTDKAAGVHISKVAGDTVDKVVEEVKELVSKNKE